VRTTKLVRKLLGFDKNVVIQDWELTEPETVRPHVVVWVRAKKRRKGTCGRCGATASWFDQGGGERWWRHIDVGYATCDVVALAPRVDCPEHGPTVAAVAWARHDSAFTRDFDDLVVRDSIVGSKQAAADRYGISWRAANNACVRVATEALGSVDLLEGVFAIAIDEVKYKKGHRYLTVVCNHATGKVIWAAKGRSKDTVRKFFKELGKERSEALQFVTCDGASWIHDVVKEKASGATICLDTFHVVGWATKALDEVRRDQWNRLRKNNNGDKAREMKGLRWILLRNWENLSAKQKSVIRELDAVNRKMSRAWQLKEELREIFKLPLPAAQRALDDWLSYASRSKLAPFVKLARTIRNYRASIEATIEWKLTNGISESNNASIGRIRANARGFHDPESFITMIMLDRGGFTPDLPWAVGE
jgi:transposase